MRELTQNELNTWNALASARLKENAEKLLDDVKRDLTKLI
jgi:uncharacterized HAD superfamily protein